MNHWWDDLQIEYDTLLRKQHKTDDDYRRMAEIETALIAKFGLDALADCPTRKE